MTATVYLAPDEPVADRPFADPAHLPQLVQTLRYMAGQVCVLLEYPYLAAEPPHIILFNRPESDPWFHRIVLAQPADLRQRETCQVVGFFGRRRPDADVELAREFDRLLVAEIPDHPGLFSYSSMALTGGNYANLVVFADSAARDDWSRSQAHAQAVQQLSPQYYFTVTIVNGHLPEGIFHHHDLSLVRAKYYDYGCQPRWQAVRELN